MNEVGLKPDDYASRSEIFEAVRKTYLRCEAWSYYDFGELFISPELDETVEEALRHYWYRILEDREAEALEGELA